MRGFAVTQAEIVDLDDLAPMFDAYRQFYQQAPDLALARNFLFERLSQQQSAILIARGADREPLGFTQLYPLFSSISARHIFLLNDLFVREGARGGGVAQRLLAEAAAFGRAAGAVRLTLSTAHTNHAAQVLYEKAGWRRDEVFRAYQLQL
ncbi:MAG: GNAT family N-acetyltransferase [Xanthobacteraceae bacterium]|nr:MAG: GNAT family N-acetyltransferase [Xanthobacteraceae bacterium]